MPDFVWFFSLGLLLGLVMALFIFLILNKQKARLKEENRQLSWEAKRTEELMRTKEELWSKGQSALSDRFAALASNILEERSKHWGIANKSSWIPSSVPSIKTYRSLKNKFRTPTSKKPRTDQPYRKRSKSSGSSIRR
jgi:hypothetical protein